MTRTSVISHPANTPMVIIRREYLDICDGSHAAAALLNHFEYLTNARRDSECDTWIRRGFRQLAEELLGLYREKSISDAVTLLLEKGFIERRHNPGDKTDRTYQYRLHIAGVNRALEKWSAQRRSSDPDTGGDTGGQAPDTHLCKTQKCDIRNGKNDECLIRENQENIYYAADAAITELDVGREIASDETRLSVTSKTNSPAAVVTAEQAEPPPKKNRSRRKAEGESRPASEWMVAFREVWPDLAPARAGSIIAMITGKARRGEWARCRLEQPLDTPEELRAFGAFMRRRMGALKLTTTIRSPEVIQQWVFDFRAEQQQQAEEREKYSFIPGYIPLSQCKRPDDFRRRQDALDKWSRQQQAEALEIMARRYEDDKRRMQQRLAEAAAQNLEM